MRSNGDDRINGHDVDGVVNTASRADRFARDGYLILRNLVPLDLCHQVRSELGPRFTAGPPRVLDAWRGSPSVRRLACLPPVLDELRDLYGRNPIPFQTLNFERGTEQRLHADTIHFDTVPSGFMCGVWVALEDVGADQGPLTFVPGSHHQAPVRVADALCGGSGFSYSRYEDIVERRTDASAAMEFHARTGDVLIWAAGLTHGGRPVLDRSTSRWSQVTHYFFDGCAYITPMSSDIENGELFVRDPLMDIRRRRAAVHHLDDQPATLIRRIGRRTELRSATAPPPGLPTRAASRVHGTVRRIAWELSPLIERIGLPRRRHGVRESSDGNRPTP